MVRSLGPAPDGRARRNACAFTRRRRRNTLRRMYPQMAPPCSIRSMTSLGDLSPTRPSTRGSPIRCGSLTPTYGRLGVHAAHGVPLARAGLGQDAGAGGDRAPRAAPGRGRQRLAGLPLPQGRRTMGARPRSSSTRSTPSSAPRPRRTKRSAASSTPATAKAPSPAAASSRKTVKTEEIPAYCAVALAGSAICPTPS